MGSAELYGILGLLALVPILRWAVVPVLVAFQLGRAYERGRRHVTRAGRALRPGS